MKILILLFLTFSAFNISAQKSFSERDAINIINTFFEGFHKGDTLIMNTVLLSNATLQSVSTTTKGEDVIDEIHFGNFKTSIAERPLNQLWEEKILEYKVSIDGNLAHVWAPYEFYLNGKFSHCGANAFTLVKLSEAWKILHLIDSRRKENCVYTKKQ